MNKDNQLIFEAYANKLLITEENDQSVCEVDEIGNKIWELNGQTHRVGGPAVEYVGGDKYWYNHGKCHREDGPAIEHRNGSKQWFLNGNYHPNIQEWGEAVLKHQKKPSDPKSVQEFLRLILAKQTKEMI